MRHFFDKALICSALCCGWGCMSRAALQCRTMANIFIFFGAHSHEDSNVSVIKQNGKEPRSAPPPGQWERRHSLSVAPLVLLSRVHYGSVCCHVYWSHEEMNVFVSSPKAHQWVYPAWPHDYNVLMMKRSKRLTWRAASDPRTRRLHHLRSPDVAQSVVS